LLFKIVIGKVKMIILTKELLKSRKFILINKVHNQILLYNFVILMTIVTTNYEFMVKMIISPFQYQF